MTVFPLARHFLKFCVCGGRGDGSYTSSEIAPVEFSSCIPELNSSVVLIWPPGEQMQNFKVQCHNTDE